MPKDKTLEKDLLAFYKILSASQRFMLGLATIMWDRDVSLGFKKKIVAMLDRMERSLIKLKGTMKEE